MAELSYSEISKLLKYEPETGKLFWLPRTADMCPSDREAKRWNARYANQEALIFSDNKGYRRGHILGRLYRAHRVAWLLHYGSWPSDQIDHINGDPADNRLTNLREVSGAENARNRSMFASNLSGVSGISWSAGYSKWRVRINGNGQTKHIGYFDDFATAISAKDRAKAEYGFHENHGRAKLQERPQQA